ncbi:MAG: lysine-2,3-aminomutase-like protein [Hyphomicrobiaceae bacterium]
MNAKPTTLRSIADLEAAGLLAPPRDARLGSVAERYAVAMTPDMARLTVRGDPADPIARQFVPDPRELIEMPGERADPIGDHVHEKLPGLVHRYPDRVLLKLTHACPVYCRFCFRREMVGPGGPAPMTGETLARAVAYIGSRSDIFEVILTGGDPLMLSPRRVREVSEALASVPHVQVLRWHSRVPVVDPGRIDAAMAAALQATPQMVYVGIHTNHVRELGPEARGAIGRLRAAGIGLVSQTVLLKGINDDAATLEALFRSLVALGVKPYYLHHADLAPGTSHFRTTIAEGQALMRALRGRLSGLAIPSYVLDIPGGHGKVPVGPEYVDVEAGSVSDPSGETHRYPAE